MTRNVALAFVVTLVTSCAAEPVAYIPVEIPSGGDDVAPNEPRGEPAIFWRSLCGPCTVQTDDNVFLPPDVAAEQSARFALQRVSSQGEIETGMTLLLPPRPPEHVMTTQLEYASGVLVFTDIDNSVEGHRDLDAPDITFPLLTPEERSALRVSSMAPFYVAFVNEPDRIQDSNVSNVFLEAGYHIARHNGVLFNEFLDRHFCRDVDPRECVGEPPPLNRLRVPIDEPITFERGGPEDLIDAFRPTAPSTQ